MIKFFRGDAIYWLIIKSIQVLLKLIFLNKVSDLNFVKKNIIERKNSKQNKSNFLIEINHQ